MEMSREKLPQEPPTLSLFGIPFHDVTLDEALEWAERRIVTGAPDYMVVVSLELLRQARHDEELRRILIEASLCLSESKLLGYVSRRFGPPLRTRITRGELAPRLLELCRKHNWSIFLLGNEGDGGASGPDKTVCSGVTVTRATLPPGGQLHEMDHRTILKQIGEVRPQLLMVVLDGPRREKWISMHVRAWRVPLAIDVGDALGEGEAVRHDPSRRTGAGALSTCGSHLANAVFLAGGIARAGLLRLAPNRPSPECEEPAPPEAALRELRATLVCWKPLPDVASAFDRLNELGPLADKHSLVLDMQRATWLLSHETGLLTNLAKRCRKNELRLLLWRPRPKVARWLQECGLDQYIPVYRRSAEVVSALDVLHETWLEGAIEHLDNGHFNMRLPTELGAFNLGRFRRLASEMLIRHPATGTCVWTVDATATEYFDSAALGFLLGLHKQAQLTGGELRLVNLSSNARRIIGLARLDFLIH